MKSEQIDKLAEALAKAQGELKNPPKNRTAKIPTKTGGSYEYNYADLPSIIETINGPLSKNGLSHIETMMDGNLTVALMHSSGQWVDSSLPVPQTTDVKILGGYLTYLRRYLLTGLVGVAADEDLDGPPESTDSKYDKREPIAVKQPTIAVVAKTPVPKTQAKSAPSEDHRRKSFMDLLAARQWTTAEALKIMKERCGKEKIADLNTQEYDALIKVINEYTPSQYEAMKEEPAPWEKILETGMMPDDLR